MEKKHVGMFNHRILLTREPIPMYEVACVYYALDGTPTDHNAAMPSTGSTNDLYYAMLEMLEAFARPILDVDEIDFARSTLDEEERHGAGAYHTKLDD